MNKCQISWYLEDCNTNSHHKKDVLLKQISNANYFNEGTFKKNSLIYDFKGIHGGECNSDLVGVVYHPRGDQL